MIEYVIYWIRNTQWDRATWRASRIQAYQCISILLRLIQECHFDVQRVVERCSHLPIMSPLQFNLSTFSSDSEAEGSKRIVVIIDDTMHLRSMRKSVMQLCKLCMLSQQRLAVH